MKNGMNLLLRKCRSLSRQLGRSSSYSSLRSKSTREDLWREEEREGEGEGEEEDREIVYVGRTRKRYVISSKHLKHPLLNALIDKSGGAGNVVVMRCEVVLFDHLLWMLRNSDPTNLTSDDCLEELTDLYLF